MIIDDMQLNWWKSLKKVRFVSSVPGVPDLHPITPMSKYMPQWVGKAREDYKQNYKHNEKFNHITLCPGIFNMFKVGWYVPMWYDVHIQTKKGEPGFKWKVATPDITEIHNMNIIDTHGEMITKYIPRREGTIDSIVKINTPYSIIAPKGMKFLFLPMPYSDNFDFESTTGILDPTESNELNVQLNWNVKDGDVFLKAGTPLMQIIPLTNENVEMICEEATEKDIKWLNKQHYFKTHSFSPIRNKIKSLYEEWYQ